MNTLSIAPAKLPDASAFGIPVPPPAPARTRRRKANLSVVPRASVAPAARRRSRGVRAAGQRAATAAAVEQPRCDRAPADARLLLSRYEPLVRQIAGGFQRKLPRNVLRDDLVAAGMSGLWDAILKHGDQHDDGFEWYVRVRVRGAILDELRAQDWLPRRARAAGTDGAVPCVVRVEDVSTLEQSRCLSAGEQVSAEDAVEQKFVRAALEKAIGKLPERERHIVSKHYFGGVKFKDLGAELGVSEPRISQLHSRAMQRLRGLMDEAA